MKLLLLLLVVAAAWWWLGAGRRVRGGQRGGAAGTAPGGRDRSFREDMPACRHCGVHLPRSDAVFGPGGEPYCSEAHRLAQGDGGTPR